MITTTQQQQILQILRPYNPERIGVFGSRARGDNRSDSDLDLLVLLGERIGLLKLVHLEMALSEALGMKVDLVTEGALKNPRLKKHIEQDLILIHQ